MYKITSLFPMGKFYEAILHLTGQNQLLSFSNLRVNYLEKNFQLPFKIH